MNVLINGIKASEHFREMLTMNPELTGRELSQLFVAQFPEINGAAVQLIRRWVGVHGGISDSDLNTGLLHFLDEAGYLKK
ncbi:hypothetical protein CLU88_2417 [Acidovorax sp. 56]|uniref:hypothetical protein n=1 Tax=Acidovorax sp. 56 TaxID=2035205 RepID=UPI000C46EA5B|nr:hypothetical protein [Acidovorax sp. 56]PIF27520.1 hypothetical protein CLU88_2417 [Acidovorax sp. 56]